MAVETSPYRGTQIHMCRGWYVRPGSILPSDFTTEEKLIRALDGLFPVYIQQTFDRNGLKHLSFTTSPPHCRSVYRVGLEKDSRRGLYFLRFDSFLTEGFSEEDFDNGSLDIAKALYEAGLIRHLRD